MPLHPLAHVQLKPHRQRESISTIPLGSNSTAFLCHFMCICVQLVKTQRSEQPEMCCSSAVTLGRPVCTGLRSHLPRTSSNVFTQNCCFLPTGFSYTADNEARAATCLHTEGSKSVPAGHGMLLISSWVQMERKSCLQRSPGATEGETQTPEGWSSRLL